MGVESEETRNKGGEGEREPLYAKRLGRIYRAAVM